MTEAEKLYQDIINMNRPEPEDVMLRHPRMAPDERAKIFSPFAAVRGHAASVSEAVDEMEQSVENEIERDAWYE